MVVAVMFNLLIFVHCLQSIYGYMQLGEKKQTGETWQVPTYTAFRPARHLCLKVIAYKYVPWSISVIVLKQYVHHSLQICLFNFETERKNNNI